MTRFLDSLRQLTHLVVFFMLLVGSCTAFLSQPHRHRSLSVSKSSAQMVVPSTRIPRPLQLTPLKNNEDSKTKQKVKQFDDGSPLGITIVVLGGLYVVNTDSDNIGIVFCAASVAAGISRLVRNYYSKNKEGGT